MTYMTSDDVPPITWGTVGATGDPDRLAASFDLMAAVLNGADLPDVLTLVATRARSVARARLAFIALPFENDNALRIAVAVGADSTRIRGLTVRRGRSMIGRVFSTRRALSSQVAKDQALGGLPAGPILLLPLETGEATRGVLAVIADTGELPFDAALARELLRFAGMSARLIELAEARRATAPART